MTAALDLADVAVRLGSREVLDGLGLTVTPGEARALVGLNGAGKTTALRVALGMLRPDRGSARVLGQDVRTGPRTMWRHVGHLVETPFCYPELTARENLAQAAALHGADSHGARARAEELSEALGLAPWLDTRTGRMSLGTRQKVGLIAALAHRPQFVVLDEPTNALDPLAVVAFRDVLRGMVADGGAVLVTSHHFDEIARVADRVDVLHAGRIVASLPPGGRDLERAFFETVVAVDRSRQDRP